MTIGEAATYIIVLSLITGLVAGMIVKKRGYSFWYYAISGFMASCGILVIIFKILMDYL